MLFVWYFSCLLMGRVPSSSQNDNGTKYSETRPMKKMFLQHLTKQTWDCLHFWGRKARSETSGTYYSDCGFKQHNMILPAQNHLENLNREWCKLEWKAFTIFYSVQSPKYSTLKRRNCTDTGKWSCMHYMYAVYYYMQSQVFQKLSIFIIICKWSLILYIIITQQQNES